MTKQVQGEWDNMKQYVGITLSGGLGNQMFQYATARAFSLRVGASVILDLSRLARENNPYALDQFSIQASIGNINSYKTRTCYKLELDNNVIVLSGYWQNEKYFSDYADQIKLEFTPSQILSPSCAALMDKLTNCNSASIHIRRGDYLEPRIREILGIVGIDHNIGYHEWAVDTLKLHHNTDEIFVFSDDPDWCTEHLNFNCKTTVAQHEGRKDYEDLILMANCKHNIISNSSFSWWGAWLNNNPDKTVIAPNPWFTVKNISSTILPDAWLSR